MKHQLRSSFSTQGRRMAGARALWTANGMKKEQMGKPIIAIVNSFTQFVPGHVHLHEIGQFVKKEIEKQGCFAAEFNTIAIDDGIAMGHDGMLYSLPSRDIIADSVEYMVNAHKADAMVCISNCDKITPGMLMAAMRLNIPTVFVSGGPMEAGEWNGQHLDLIDAMIKSADESVSDQEVAKIEQHACPTCGCCSGMFTANSMNCLNEAIGLALPGNGTIVATHENRKKLFEDAARLIVENAYKYYEEGDETVLPRSIATREAFLNAMTLDIAMGGLRIRCFTCWQWRMKPGRISQWMILICCPAKLPACVKWLPILRNIMYRMLIVPAASWPLWANLPKEDWWIRTCIVWTE